VSGPLLDRIDLQVRMARVDPAELVEGLAPESSAVVAPRIARARAAAVARNRGVPNARLPGADLLAACALSPGASARLRDVAGTEALSARSLHRLLRVARTIADLRDAPGVEELDVLAALALRQEVLARGLAA
jgi:magnesium chelatase family protein